MLLVPRVAFATACSAAALNQGQLLMSWLCSRRTMLTSSLPTYRGFVSHRYGAFPTMPCERDACGRLGERRRLACGRASLDPDCASASSWLHCAAPAGGYCRSSSLCRQPALENVRETARERRGVGELFAFDDSGLVEKKPGKFGKLV